MKIANCKIENYNIVNLMKIGNWKLKIGLIALLLFLWSNQASAFTISKPSVNNTGLVGWWTFDGKDITSGRANDVSGQGNHGNLVNIATSTFYTMGKLGQGFNFDGGDDRINAPNINVTSTFSLSAWIKPTSVASTYAIMGERSGTSRTWAFYVRPTGQLGFTLSAINDYNSSSAGLLAGVWQHVIAVINGTSLTIYKDGVSVYSTTMANTVVNDSTALGIGDQNGDSASSPFLGSLDDVRIYNRALSQAEITALYNRGAATKTNKTISTNSALTNGLVGHWTFDGRNMANGVAADISGNGNNCNLKNIATSTFYASGKLGQAVNFDATDDYIDCGNPSSLQITGNTITLSAWIHTPETVPANGDRLIVKEMSGNNDPYVAYVLYRNNSTATFWFGVSTGVAGSFNQVGNTTALVANQWYHVVGVYNGTDLRLYLNGALDSTPVAETDNIGSTAESVVLGADTAPNPDVEHLNGKLDDVRVYNRALSASEVSSLYNLGAPVKVAKSLTGGSTLSTGLVGWWTFDGKDITSGRANDVSGSGNHGNLANIATSTFYAVGKLGQGFNFDGTDDYVDFGDVLDLNATDAWCFSSWVYLTSTPGEQVFIVSKNEDAPAYEGYSLSTNGSGQILLEYLISFTGNDWYQKYVSGNVLTPLSWHHVVACNNNEAVTIYLNGVSQSITVGIDTLSGNINTTSHFNIGSVDHDARGSFPGKIDDVRLYNRVLTQAEITQLYNLGR